MLFNRDLARYLFKQFLHKKAVDLGGSPGLVVMGGDSCSEGCGFESQLFILD